MVEFYIPISERFLVQFKLTIGNSPDSLDSLTIGLFSTNKKLDDDYRIGHQIHGIFYSRNGLYNVLR